MAITTGLESPPKNTERQPRRLQLGRWDLKYSPYLYIAPFFLLFIVTGLFPLVYTGFIALQDWDVVRNSGTFSGFANFNFVLHDPQFWRALRNTFSIFILSSVPQIILAMFIAAMLDYNLRARTFWRMGVLLPYVVAPVAVALIFSNMFGDQYGLVNSVLGHFGIPPVGWHSGVLPSHIAIATMVDFRWTGYNALILLAAMQAIPRELYEAAAIDGAGGLRRYVSVSIPQLRPTLIFVIITSTIGGLQIFDEPRMYDTTGLGGASQQWMTITLYLYNQGWNNLDFGRASAAAWLLFLLIVVFVLLNLLLTSRFVANDDSRRK